MELAGVLEHDRLPEYHPRIHEHPTHPRPRRRSCAVLALRDDHGPQAQRQVHGTCRIRGFCHPCLADGGGQPQRYPQVDGDYVRRAQRKLNNQDSGELVEFYKTNLRIIELCDKAIEVNSSNAEAYYLKGRALVNLDKYPQAIDEYINSLAIDDDVKVWIAIANANTLNGDYDDALNVYDSVLKKDEESFEAIKGKALTYYACGDFKKADDEFKKAAAIDSLDSYSKEIWDECLEKI